MNKKEIFEEYAISFPDKWAHNCCVCEKYSDSYIFIPHTDGDNIDIYLCKNCFVGGENE